MTTAVDSNVLIDLIGPPSAHTDAAVTALDRARAEGALVVCPVVPAEIASYFSSAKALEHALQRMGIRVVEFTLADLHLAGSAYVSYCRRSSKPKPRMLADFLIAAHALGNAGALLSRHRGYYRTYFPRLKVIGP